jgi:hypothetical protein
MNPKTKTGKITISKGIVAGIKGHQKQLVDECYAKVGILASSKKNEDAPIDNVYFIRHRGSGGCEDFPQLRRKEISLTVCKVIKEKKTIRGLLLIPANNHDGGMNGEFRVMIQSKGWLNKKFVYMTCGYEEELECFKYESYESYSNIPFTLV